MKGARSIHWGCGEPDLTVCLNDCFADTDMNAELVAHGFSNALSGLFGGELVA